VGLKDWIADKFMLPPRSADIRVQYETMWAVLSERAPQLRATEARMCETTTMVWRQVIAEKLGRDLCDTLMPGEVNGIAIVIDSGQPHGHITLVYHSGEQELQQTFDITEVK